MADLSDSPSSGHGQAGSTMEPVGHGGEDIEMRMSYAMRKLVDEFEVESSQMEWKIHRVPASLADMGDQFILPMALAIGPYHRHLPRVQGMQKAKRVAAYTITRNSDKSLEEMYSLVLAVADMGRRMYDDDVVSGISPDEFADMMFHDGCFLLQYMLSLSLSPEVDAMSSLQRFFLANEACISNDIMLLENQLPWLVIEVLMTASAVDVDVFIANMGNSMSNISRDEHRIGYTLSNPAPHLLGHLVLQKQRVSDKGRAGIFRALSAPMSAMEFEEIGIKLDHNKTDVFGDIGIIQGPLFDKFFLPSLRLDRIRTTWLANMVALEVCTASYSSQSTNDSVCSYVAFLAMLVDREEDVHKLRSEGFIHGDLSDKQILEFFNGLAQKISPGANYFEILAAIEDCKRKRWLRIMVCKFVSSNAKAIAAVLSIIGALVGVFKALYSLKQH